MVNLVSFAPLETAATVSTDSISGIFYSDGGEAPSTDESTGRSAELRADCCTETD